jgi:hypothetical protein
MARMTQINIDASRLQGVEPAIFQRPGGSCAQYSNSAFEAGEPWAGSARDGDPHFSPASRSDPGPNHFGSPRHRPAGPCNNCE